MKRTRKVSRIILIILLIAVIGFSSIEIWKISAVYLREAKTKDTLSAYRPGSPGNRADVVWLANGVQYGAGGTAGGGDSDNGASGGGSQDRPVINRSIIDLRNDVNADVAGWITIPNTHIDYPFVSCGDNSYYLNRDIYGNIAPAGTLFLDQRCAPDLSDFNTIIYGHNMRNNTMFGDLPLFADEWFFNSNRYGTIYTEYDTFTLDIFALLVVSAEDETIYDPFANGDAFFRYVKQRARNYREPDRDLSVVTLSTCGYEFSGARIVVIASLVPDK